jgi:hypothetical protein
MLREISRVRQDTASLRRRWFQDDFFDLYTWSAPGGMLVGFQLCYDVHGRERVLSWHWRQGFSHSTVAGGDGARPYPMAPILAAAGQQFPHRWVRGRFAERAATLDAATRRLILDKMREYSRAQAR